MRYIKIIGILFLSSLVFTGCSSSANKSGPMESSTEEMQKEDVDYQGDAYEEVYDEVAEELGVERDDSQIDSNQKLIYRAYLSVEVREKLNPLIKSMQSFVKNHGGYIESMEQYTVGYDPITEETLEAVYMYIRIPHKHHDKTIQTIEELGQVTSKNTSVEDVTLQYSDIESTLKMYKLEQKRLLEMLEKETSDIKDIIEIEKRLSEVRIEIEKQESARRLLESQINYDTIELNMSEVRKESDLTSSKSFGSRIKRTFKESIYTVVVTSQKIVLGLVYLFIPLVLLATIVGIFYVPVKKLLEWIKSKKQEKDSKKKDL